jgi:uracil phosphoribosyltransferase
VTGASLCKAVGVLQDHGVAVESIICLNLFATPDGIGQVLEKFPKVRCA